MRPISRTVESPTEADVATIPTVSGLHHRCPAASAGLPHAIGHRADCEQRVQGRHPLQTSDAFGAAAAQLGPAAIT
jgi:hypothetical protein